MLLFILADNNAPWDQCCGLQMRRLFGSQIMRIDLDESEKVDYVKFQNLLTKIN